MRIKGFNSENPRSKAHLRAVIRKLNIDTFIVLFVIQSSYGDEFGIG